MICNFNFCLVLYSYREVEMKGKTLKWCMNSVKSKYSEFTIILKDTPLWDRLKNIDLDIKKSQNNGLEVPFENKTFDLNNADPEFKGAGGGTTLSITPFIDYNVFINYDGSYHSKWNFIFITNTSIL